MEQQWEDVSHKHFHPIAHMWTHFSQLRCSFLHSSPLVGVQGEFFGDVMDKTQRGRLGLPLETNECVSATAETTEKYGEI